MEFIGKYEVFGFDLFGTLVDIKNKEVVSKLQKFCKRKNLDFRQIATLWKIENKSLTEIISGKIFLTEDDKKYLVELEKLIEKELTNSTIKPYTKELLDLLKENGKSLFLISNLGKPYEKVLEKYNLASYFDLVVFSYEVGFVKPQKEIYELAIDKYKNKKIIFSGDTYKADVLGPKLAGIDGMNIKDLVNYLLK